jgi:drug/metabolite transporter (DMT)-like permease
MVPVLWIGAFLVVCGILLMARTAIFRDELSDPHASPDEPGGVTLEPHRRGLRFLGLKANWPGVLLMAIGALLLLIGGLL